MTVKTISGLKLLKGAENSQTAQVLSYIERWRCRGDMALQN